MIDVYLYINYQGLETAFFYPGDHNIKGSRWELYPSDGLCHQYFHTHDIYCRVDLSRPSGIMDVIANILLIFLVGRAVQTRQSDTHHAARHQASRTADRWFSVSGHVNISNRFSYCGVSNTAV